MRMRVRTVALASLLLCIAEASLDAHAQSVSGASLSGRALAPVDLTGYWVSVITEDWYWRMETPLRGDYESLPLNDAGIRAADRWDGKVGRSCLMFGAATLLRQPTRVHITWADDNTLRIDADNGEQTRLLHFDSRADAPNRRSRQGYSVANWEIAGRVVGSGATAGILTTDLALPPWASLKAVTTNLTAGWLRSNGVPYSEDAIVTEYFDRYSDGENEWFTVTTEVDDPAYLTEPLLISSNFKREPDGSKWNAQPCDER